MNNKDETYLTAHSNLQSALVNFVVASYAVNLDEEAIASATADIIYDYNKKLFETMRRSMLPMVKEFELSKSDKFADLEKDWQAAMEEWEKKQMWKVLSK